ncbi:hypothetical protein EQV77_06745 [Halobacillus fulvus]|nr:hypothetical protein EQV77_06745 [Halobacillus fulvus]
MNRLDRHVEKILTQMQSDEEERNEIKEELLSHLVEMKEEAMSEGSSEKQAEKKAIERFGGAGMIGNGLQETMYPYQRGLLYLIGIASLVLGILLHFQLLLSGEPSPIWLLIQFVLGGAVTFVAMNISLLGRFYWSMNTLVFLNMGWNGINYFLVIQFSPTPAYLYMVYLGVLLIASLVFIFRNSYFQSVQPENDKKERHLKTWSHLLNLLFGLAITIASLFFTWAMLAFSEFSWRLFIPLGFIVAWLVFYKFQMKLIRTKPITAIFTGILFIVLIASAPFTILQIVM